jgi:hypothetical protein
MKVCAFSMAVDNMISELYRDGINLASNLHRCFGQDEQDLQDWELISIL